MSTEPAKTEESLPSRWAAFMMGILFVGLPLAIITGNVVKSMKTVTVYCTSGGMVAAAEFDINLWFELQRKGRLVIPGGPLVTVASCRVPEP